MTTPPNARTAATNPYAPPRASVRDIADPTAGVQLADRGTRLAAIILDTFIFGIMVYAPLFVILFARNPPSAAPEDATDTMMMVGGALTLIGFTVWAWLSIRYVSRNGQSIGKKMLNIKVLRSDGSRATLGRIFWLRNIVNGVLSIIPLYGIIDSLFIFGESRRCLHDKIADTIVVKA